MIDLTNGEELINMDYNRLKLSAEAEKEFIKTCAIIDYAESKLILEAVNKAILSGVKTNDIIKELDVLSKAKSIDIKF